MSTAANPVTLEHVLLMLASTSWTLFWRLKVSKGCKNVPFRCALTPVRMCALVNLLTKSSWTTRNQWRCMLGKNKTLVETQHRWSKFHEGCLVPGCRSFSRTVVYTPTRQTTFNRSSQFTFICFFSAVALWFYHIQKYALNADSRRRNSHLGKAPTPSVKNISISIQKVSWSRLNVRPSPQEQRLNMSATESTETLLRGPRSRCRLSRSIPFFSICWVTQCKLANNRCINKFHALTSSTITAGNNCKHSERLEH